MSDSKLTFAHLISANDLKKQLASPQPPVIFDCRARLGDAQWGPAAYAEGHIDGAQFLDLDRDLAAAPDERGRHPLPDREDWLATVRRLGVNNDDQIVLYDDAFGAYAARGWWMFRWLGHARVAVLDGGLPAWQEPLTTTTPTVGTSQFSASEPLTRLIATTDLVASLDRLEGRLIDARAEARFSGQEEPIDPVAGHIPGAVCLAFQGNLSDDGTFLPPAALQERFSGLPEDPVCYCGSGVTACHNILAMRVAGLAEPTLYASSWSGWITDSTRPVATS